MDSESNSFIEVNSYSLAVGIGKKAGDEELSEYLSTGIDEESININEAFSKYLIEK